MIATEKFTSADLLLFPQNGKKYEIVAGELLVSRQPSYEHQFTCGRAFRFLDMWDDARGLGAAIIAPGIIFADDDDVAPDVVWISRELLTGGTDQAGHLCVAPELVIEVLSPGSENARRDRETKLNLYSRRGVTEYWIVDWMRRRVEVFRRENATLSLVATLFADDILSSPLLPGFSCRVGNLFFLP